MIFLDISVILDGHSRPARRDRHRHNGTICVQVLARHADHPDADIRQGGSVLAGYPRLQHWSIISPPGPEGLRLVVAVDGDSCLLEEGGPIAGHARPFKTRIELSPLLGRQGVDDAAKPGT